MLKKLNNKKGFTLMEMLIVVAIIAVLVAVAIPTFTSALNKAKAGTDLANIRSGYAAAQLEAITKDSTAARTYYLKKDGSVGDTGADDYVCGGNASDAEATANVGGKENANSIKWKKGQKITYTVNANDNKVNGIAAVD